jgi:hypothetical protein
VVPRTPEDEEEEAVMYFLTRRWGRGGWMRGMCRLCGRMMRMGMCACILACMWIREKGGGEVRESDEEVVVGFDGAMSEGMMGRSWIVDCFLGDIPVP